MCKSNNLTKNVYTYDDVIQKYGFNPDDVFKEQGIKLNNSEEYINTYIRARYNRYLITRMNTSYLNIDYSNIDKVTMHNLIRYIIDDVDEFSEINISSGKKHYASINFDN